MNERPPKCAFCKDPATTTAVQVPVCEAHWQEYKTEAELYLPEHERKFICRLNAYHLKTLTR